MVAQGPKGRQCYLDIFPSYAMLFTIITVIICFFSLFLNPLLLVPRELIPIPESMETAPQGHFAKFSSHVVPLLQSPSL